MQTKRRFGRTISVIEISENMTQVLYEYIDEEFCKLFYNRLNKVFEAYLQSGSVDKLICKIEFITSDYISMLCRAGETLVALNYDLKKECFESDKMVLKRENCRKNEIRKKLKKIDKKLPHSPFAVHRIPDGVALYFDREKPVRVKIRHDNTKKLNFS